MHPTTSPGPLRAGICYNVSSVVPAEQLTIQPCEPLLGLDGGTRSTPRGTGSTGPWLQQASSGQQQLPFLVPAEHKSLQHLLDARSTSAGEKLLTREVLAGPDLRAHISLLKVTPKIRNGGRKSTTGEESAHGCTVRWVPLWATGLAPGDTSQEPLPARTHSLPCQPGAGHLTDMGYSASVPHRGQVGLESPRTVSQTQEVSLYPSCPSPHICWCTTGSEGLSFCTSHPSCPAAATAPESPATQPEPAPPHSTPAEPAPDPGQTGVGQSLLPQGPGHLLLCHFPGQSHTPCAGGVMG